MPDLPALEERFTRPDNWRDGEFVNLSTGHKIHYAFGMPPASRGIVVLLPGLSEFSEKYYETARDLLARGFGVWIIDWAYQGRSSRLDTFPMRRTSDGFETDVQDLHKLISDHILPAANGAPLIMLGHSMGGHLGLRYLATHAGLFKSAILSAPMLGIRQISNIPHFLLSLLLFILRPFYGRYVPGERDWHEAMRKSDGTDIFSSDPVRDRLHHHWSLHYPELRIGGVTFRWVYEAVRSCRWLMPRLPKITIPVLLAAAQDDKIVDNAAIARAAALLPAGRMITLPGAHHEIMMERDDVRNRFFEGFDKWVAEPDSQ